MAGDQFRKVIPGNPLSIPAAAYNAFVDAAIAHQNRAAVGGSGAGPMTALSNTIRLKNETGANLPQFSVVGIGNPVTEYSANISDQFEFSQNPRFFKADLPTVADHTERFALVIGGVTSNANEVASCAIGGIYPCQVDVTDEAHEFAGIKDGVVTELLSGSTGPAQILWKAAGTGTKWAIIKFPIGGGGTFSVVQAIADGAAGVVPVKTITLKANVAASPNFEQAAGDPVNVNYFKL